jgi:aryl-alcohol dehydrogenase-like predicted oxidoreductase
MANQNLRENTAGGLTRRGFLIASGAAAVGVAAVPALVRAFPPEVKPGIWRHRTLGRTGFIVGDISMGCGSIAESDVVRYAYDHGVNLFDTAESYGNGDSERKIGEAMQHMQRDKIFIVTKVGIDDEPDQQDLVERFHGCLERLQTSYADALYCHGIADADLVEYEPFLKACDQLKAEGKLKHAGISSHGPRGDEPDAMDTVLIKAAESGHYDVMLLSYGFINAEEAERVLKVCKDKNIGTTIMKSATGLMEMPVLDLENPSELIQGWIDYLADQGVTGDEAAERITNYFERQKPYFAESYEGSKPFVAKYGITTQDELDLKSLQWVLANPDAHTICPSMPTFDDLDRILPLSGTWLGHG